MLFNLPFLVDAEIRTNDVTRNCEPDTVSASRRP